MLRIMSTVLLCSAAGTALASEALNKERAKLGLVASAAMSARTGTFAVLEGCENRFPDLQAEGAALRAAYTSRNAPTERRLAALTAKLAAKIQVQDPGTNIDAVLVKANEAARSIAVDEYAKLMNTMLNAPTAVPRSVCQTMFGHIDKGATDITRIQKSANLVLQSADIDDFLTGYKGVSFDDRAQSVLASGSWLGLNLPVHVANVTAAKADNTIRISLRTLVDLGDRALTHVASAEATAVIASWSDDFIRSEATREGTSQRYVQYVIDRKSKSVSMIYSGETQATHLLGDASGPFRKMQLRYQ